MKLETLLYLLAVMAGIVCGLVIAIGWQRRGPDPDPYRGV